MKENNNFKMTNQRAAILEVLKDNHDHPSVDEVYRKVRKRLPRISKKTVYSNLSFLSEKKIIQEVRVRGITRYEPIQDSHHHMICNMCNRIFDVGFEVGSKELSKKVMRFADKIDGFDIENVSVNFYGICKRCGGKKNGKRRK